MYVQGGIALAVLAGATFLGISDVLDSEAISVLYGAALGAVGGGAVGYRASTSGTTTQTFHDSNGGSMTTTRKQGGE